MTCSAIRKVSGAYKSMKSSKRLPDEPAEFSKRCLDLEGGSRGRDFRLYPDKGIVSISTVEGRKKLAYRCGAFQRSYLESPEWSVQAAKLVYKRRRKGWRYELKGTRSSARTFARVAGRETRLTRDFQNTTAKSLVRLALDSGCGAVAVERLNGIREHTGTRDRKARYHRSTWAYARFLDILRHKAEGAGLELIEVDPANTSRTCCACRCVDKASRKGLSFSCTQCGYSLHADANAARNIRLRAILQRQAPLEDGAESCAPKPTQVRLRTASCLPQLAVHD